MKKFIVLYHAPEDALEQTADPGAEEQAEGMKAWMEWAKKCGDHLVDLGTPLVNGQRIGTDEKSTTSKLDIAGYSILQAESMKEAKALLKGHPHLGWHAGCAIEVHETMPMPGS